MQTPPDAAGLVDLAYRRDLDAVSAALLTALQPLETRSPPVHPEAVLRMLCALLAQRASQVDMSLHALTLRLHDAYYDRAVKAAP